jgi:hypothetical protein
MALLNRDKDPSEQRNLYQWSSGGAVVSTSATLPIFTAQNSEQILGFQVVSVGLSGAPILTFQIGRFLIGSGFTMLSSGFSAITCVAFGTSGLPGVGTSPIIQLVAGSTLNQLQKNDAVFVSTSGANTAGSHTISMVTQTLQDIKQTYGF